MNRHLNIKTYENKTLLSSLNTTCLLEDTFLTFNTDNETIRLNLNNFSFTKENNETIFKLTKDKCRLTLKELENTMEIPIDYINYEIKNKEDITIEYKLISQDNPLKVQIKIGDEINEI